MLDAVVVLFQPDIPLLERVLGAICSQVDAIFVVDNTPHPSAELAPILSQQTTQIRYIALGSNQGIAAAQNAAIRGCLCAGYSHLLFLDQDTVAPPGLVETLLGSEKDLLRSGIRVGAVGPMFVDQKTNALSYAIRYEWFRARKIFIEPPGDLPVESDWLISSGSLIRSAVLEEVGSMRDDLFIDWVDAEWGLRARSKGFKHFMVPNALMEHSIGDDSVELFNHSFNMHSTARNFYIVRNATYLLRPKGMGWKWVTAMLLRIPKHIAVHAWYSNHRWQNLAVMLKAVVAGACGRLGPIPS
jgi:rhamnosyltransferase